MAGIYDPFSESILRELFHTYPGIPDRPIKRESANLEFKENFHKGKELDRYGKTMAAFANNEGGYIVFGVADKPRTLVGMTNRKFEKFRGHELTEYLNNKFAPEIVWDKHTYEIEGKKFGLIYVREGDNKPVVAKTNGGDVFKEGEIFYRYRGRSEKIKYPELIEIFNVERQKIHDTWFNHLRRISKIGVENAAIFNPEDGTVTGKGGQFVIDEDLLPKLKFIKEGEFNEITGEPTIKVVGEAQTFAVGHVTAVKTKTEVKSIHADDVIKDFLKQRRVPNPKEYIIEICYSNASYLPIYFYMGLAKMDLTETIKLIQCEEHCNLGSRNNLIARLSKDDPNLPYKFPDSWSETLERRRVIRERLIAQKLGYGIGHELLPHVFAVIRSLRRSEIRPRYLFPLLLYWYENAWRDIPQPSQTAFRKAVCYLDYTLFKRRKIKRRRVPSKKTKLPVKGR